MVRVLICGGRSFNDRDAFDSALSSLHADHIEVVIQGGAKGADYLAREWAEDNNYKSETYHANWNRHGLSAGPIRNLEMIEQGKPDLVIAFPGDKGTANMIKQAVKAEIKVRQFRWVLEEI